MIFGFVLLVVVAGFGVAIAMGKNNVLVGSRDPTVAMGSRGVERTGGQLVAAAAQHGWQVLLGAAAERPFAPDLVMRHAPAIRCEQVVTGIQPRNFVAETWLVDRRKPGALLGSDIRQHLLTVPISVRVPRFAIGRDGTDANSAAWSVPDDLAPFASGFGDGLTLLGDDQGTAQALRPWLSQVRDARVWVVVAGDRVVLSRYGAVGPDELARRLGLAAELANALEQGAANSGRS